MPSVGSEFIQLGFDSFFADVFTYFVKGLNADIQHIIVFVDESDGLLYLSSNLYFLESGKFSDTVVDMGDIITWLKFPQQPDIQGLFFGEASSEAKLMESLENLVVGQNHQTKLFVNKAF